MTDDNANEPRDPNAAENSAAPKKGTFGAFADKYRDRWAAGHPNAKKPGGRDVAPGTAAPETIAPTTPRAADGDDADAAPGT